jgi:methylmalonyl-CoA/ethylmalonyl-CoA epimerase
VNSTVDLRLHHLGFVVHQIQASAPGFVRSLGAAWDGIVYEDPHQRVKVTFLETSGSDSKIELVEPASENSPVTRFLREHGGGLHHVCYEVEDLDRSLKDFRGRGAVIAKRPLPAVAFAGRRIAWVVTPEKLLVELLERTRQSGNG